MKPRLPRPGGGSSGVLIGLVRTALGRADGLTYFAASVQGFLSSLAPLIAFPLVGAFLVAVQGHASAAATDFLATICALLFPPVLSFELARLWRRQGQWLHYATAFNWCQWAIPIAAILLLALAFPPLSAFFSARNAAVAVLFAVGCYGLWLHWFIARIALAISGVRAVLLVVAVNFGTGILLLVPTLLASGIGKLEIAG